MKPLVAVGRRIRQIRERSGLNLVEAAQRSGISWSTIQRLEMGRGSQPRLEVAGAILRGIGADDATSAWCLLRLAGYNQSQANRVHEQLK